MTKHTALPWKVVAEDIGDETFIYAPVGIKGADGFDVVSYEGGFTPNSEWKLDVIKANADFIIRACNSHDELVEALKAASVFIKNGIELGFIRMPDKDIPDPAHLVPGMVETALAKAEGDWEDSLIERPEIGREADHE
jgi:hypothetical protein